MVDSPGMIEGPFESTVRWARETRLADGRRVIDEPWVQTNLARIHARLEFLRLMNYKVAWSAEQDGSRAPRCSRRSTTSSGTANGRGSFSGSTSGWRSTCRRRSDGTATTRCRS